MRRNILSVKNWHFNKSHIFILFGKLRHIGSFRQKVHLLLSHSPQFAQNHVQIYHALDTYRRHQTYGFVHQADIPCHGFIDSLALNLDHNLFSGFQRSSVNLGNGCGTQRLLLNILKFLLPGATHGFLQNLDHL